MELLEQFRMRAGRMVFVVDEYGVVQGLMTPHDLLEAITGELQPGAQADAWATEREDGSWLLDGLMPVSELQGAAGDPRPARRRQGPLQHAGGPADGRVGPPAGRGRARSTAGAGNSRSSSSTAGASTRCWRIRRRRRCRAWRPEMKLSPRLPHFVWSASGPAKPVPRCSTNARPTLLFHRVRGCPARQVQGGTGSKSAHRPACPALASNSANSYWPRSAGLCSCA